MKIRIMLLTAFAAAAFQTSAADAQTRSRNAPYDAWCRDAQIGTGGGGVRICDSYTFEQCMASRASHIETCYLNPLYDPRFSDWRRRNPNY